MPAFPANPLMPLATMRAVAQPYTGYQPRGYDPFDIPAAPRPKRRKRASQSTELTPEEERSLWQHLMGFVQYVGETFDKPGAAVRGVVGGVTDIAQGQTPEWGGGALNLIPFSDFAGITDPQERVRGRQLGQKWGWWGENKPGLDWGDVGGFGVELGLDPLLGATGPLGTLLKAGKAGEAARAARLAGKATKLTEALGTVKSILKKSAKGTPPPSAGPLPITALTAAEQIRKSERALFGFRAPTLRNTFFGLKRPGLTREAAVGFNLMPREWAAQLVERLYYGGGGKLSNVLLGIPHAAIVGTRALFDPKVSGYIRPAMHRAKDAEFAERTLLHAALTDAVPLVASRVRDMHTKYLDIAHHHGADLDPMAFDEFAREAVELSKTVPKQEELVALMRRSMGLKKDVSLNVAVANDNALVDKMFEMLDGMDTVKNAAWERYQNLGGRGEDLKELYGLHFPRKPSIKTAGTVSGKEGLAAFTEHAKRRAGVLRDWPGMTRTVNAVTRDPFLTATAGRAKQLQPILLRELKKRGVKVPEEATFRQLQREWAFAHHIDPALQQAYPVKGMTRQLGKKSFTYEDEVAAWKGETVGIETAQKARGAAKGRIDDILDYTTKLPKTVLEKGLFDRPFFVDWFDYMESVLHATSTLRSAHYFLRRPGAVARAGDEAAENMTSLVDAWSAAGMKKRGLETFVKENAQTLLKADESLDDIGAIVDDLMVDPATAKGLFAFQEVLKPQTVGELGRIWDKVNSFYKGWMTIPWMPFHVRNAYSGYFQSLSDGFVVAGELNSGYGDFWKYARGKADAKTRGDVQTLIDSGVLKEKGWKTDIAGEIIEAGSKYQHGFAKGFAGRRMPGGWKKRRLERGWSEADIKEHSNWYGRTFGMTGATREVPPSLAEKGVTSMPPGAIAEAGEEMYLLVEGLNRGGYGLALLRKGYTPSQINHLVKRSQFDYAELARHDAAIRRAVPFWSWTKRSIPYTLVKLFERPGGMTAQTIRAFTRTGEEGEAYTPSWMRERLAVPWSGTPEEMEFLSQIGLPIEDLNKIVFQQGKPSGRTLERVVSELHPLLQMPIKVVMGKDPFTGRKLKDLRGITGDPRLDFAIQASPLGRAVGEYRRVKDVDISEPLSMFPEMKSGLPNVLGGRKPIDVWLLNNLTGLRFQTQDVEKWKLIDFENALKRKVGESKYTGSFEVPYVYEEHRKTGVAKEEQEDIRRISAIAKILKKLRDERKKQKAQEGR